LLAAAGIRVGFFLQLGYLGEELDDILATRHLVDEARPDDVGVSVSYPLPGTKFYESVKLQLGEKTHWQESNDLEMMFSGTYVSEFYRALRNLLHDQVKEPDSPEVARRWNALIASERAYRQDAADGAQFGAAFAGAVT
jgi:anaerobic magnesium-protoporphyrin IX monomethyl ester cyclase